MPCAAFVGVMLLLALWCNIETAVAQGVGDFYKGKQIRLIIGYPAGAAQDQ